MGRCSCRQWGDVIVAEQSDDLYEQRSLLAGRSFKDEDLSRQAHERRAAAVEKARTHEDDYIRHRLRIQLGESEGPFLSITS